MLPNPRSKVTPYPTSKPSQNAIATHPVVTKTKTTAPLLKTKQTKLDSALAMLKDLTKEELKKVIAKTKELAKSACGE